MRTADFLRQRGLRSSGVLHSSAPQAGVRFLLCLALQLQHGDLLPQKLLALLACVHLFLQRSVAILQSSASFLSFAIPDAVTYALAVSTLNVDVTSFLVSVVEYLISLHDTLCMFFPSCFVIA